MTTSIVPAVTDELIAELEAAASDSKLNIYRPLGWAHSVRCGNHLQTDFDFLSLASPETVLALLAHIADLKQQLAAASITAENCETFRRNAERYLFLRNLHYDLMGSAGIPCAAIPSSGISGVYANGYDLDAAIDAARDIAAMDIGSGD